MSSVVAQHRVFLIGGSSHAGKSCLAQLLCSQLGWSYRSTDKLARHPGRPWQVKPKTVPIHVADHYLSLTVDNLIADVLSHYKDNVWPLIREIVTFHSTDLSTNQLIIEGSAILPEQVATLGLSNVAAIWLTADNKFFKQRIYEESQYEVKSPRDKEMIDKFLKRTCLYNARIRRDTERLELVSVDVENTSDRSELVRICLAALESQDF
ncbi:MAG: hypothetical protein WBB01_18660 [Phormidesmis sp.]